MRARGDRWVRAICFNGRTLFTSLSDTSTSHSAASTTSFCSARIASRMSAPSTPARPTASAAKTRSHGDGASILDALAAGTARHHAPTVAGELRQCRAASSRSERARQPSRARHCTFIARRRPHRTARICPATNFRSNRTQAVLGAGRAVTNYSNARHNPVSLVLTAAALFCLFRSCLHFSSRKYRILSCQSQTHRVSEALHP
jgi:hypothetical protein